MATFMHFNIPIVLRKRLPVPNPYRSCEQRRKWALTAGSFACWLLVRRVEHDHEHVTSLATGQLFTCRHTLEIGTLS